MVSMNSNLSAVAMVVMILCSVESSGGKRNECPYPYYGNPQVGCEPCNPWCNTYGPNELCHQATGKCRHGCQGPWQGDYCNSSCDKSEFYGKMCLSRCSSDCQMAQCDAQTGNCFACKPGKRGNKCDQTQRCPLGKFGQWCHLDCHCAGERHRCDQTNGQCPSGCEEGYFGHDCQQECPLGFYGPNCEKKCSELCKSGRCSTKNGSCEGPCSKEVMPPLCLETSKHPLHFQCAPGSWGISCGKTCKKCGQTTLNPEGRCYAVTGKCPDDCPLGTRGTKCDLKCEAKTWGPGCGKKCVDCLHGCDKDTGECSNGKCMPGKTGKICDQDCKTGTYGYACNETCGECIGGDMYCKKDAGVCELGCKGPYRDEQCKICAEGHWGWKCMMDCSSACTRDQCGHLTGGCGPGCPSRQDNTEHNADGIPEDPVFVIKIKSPGGKDYRPNNEEPTRENVRLKLVKELLAMTAYRKVIPVVGIGLLVASVLLYKIRRWSLNKNAQRKDDSDEES